jgi:hypothetical protein
MVHPDYQYTPKLIPAMVAMVATGLYGAVLGSRILGGRALAGGMPRWRYVGNRFLTLAQNLLIGAKLSEYHTGYRAFSRELLERLPLDANSEGFDFDAEVLAQIVWFGYVIGEVSCPTRCRATPRHRLRRKPGCASAACGRRSAIDWRAGAPPIAALSVGGRPTRP